MTQTRLLFCRVAWLEDNGKEYEMTAPTNWLCKNDTMLRWPNVVNVDKYILDRKPPTNTWKTFVVVKIKYWSGKFY